GAALVWQRMRSSALSAGTRSFPTDTPRTPPVRHPPASPTRCRRPTPTAGSNDGAGAAHSGAALPSLRRPPRRKPGVLPRLRLPPTAVLRRLREALHRVAAAVRLVSRR